MSEMENNGLDFSRLSETNFKVETVNNDSGYNPTADQSQQLPNGSDEPLPTGSDIDPTTGLESTEPTNGIDNELDEAKKKVEESTPEEKQKNEYNLKKMENMARLEGRWRNEKTSLTSENQSLKAQIAEMKGQKSVGSFKTEMMELAKRNPKKFFDQFEGNSELFFDQHMGVTGLEDEKQEPKNVTQDDINKMVADGVKAAMTERDKQDQQTSFDNSVKEYQATLKDLTNNTADYPIMKRFGNDDLHLQAYESLRQARNRQPTPKEVMDTCEAYCRQEMDAHNKQPTRTLNSNMSSPPPPGAVPTQSQPGQYDSLTKDEREFKMLVDRMPG